MWKYCGMNGLGENTSWVRFAKRNFKMGKKYQNTAPGGWYLPQTKPKPRDRRQNSRVRRQEAV
jgi:hypothetical protein